ncbi:MAG: helix-turn-helix transcriptional regulator [Clostridiales bacterium]|nr:helix-turn-helix transcriptional regulator [Candidatus Apopatousia equi]
MKTNIKDRLKELRKENNLTQKQIAKMLKKSETGYASWEQGLSEPGINDIITLCEIYNISADYLLGIKEY